MRELVPELDFEGSSLRDETIEDVLSHRSGVTGNAILEDSFLLVTQCLPVEAFGPFLVGYDPNVTRHDLALIAAKLPMIHRNREAYHYSNHAFTTAGTD